MEKFALLNLLNALSSLNFKPSGEQGTAENPPAQAAAATDATVSQNKNTAASEQPAAYPNVMASVLERHEAISNRIKNKK